MSGHPQCSRWYASSKGVAYHHPMAGKHDLGFLFKETDSDTQEPVARRAFKVAFSHKSELGQSRDRHGLPKARSYSFSDISAPAVHGTGLAIAHNTLDMI